MKESNSFKVDDQIEFFQNYVIVRTNCPKSKLPELKKKISHFSSDYKKNDGLWFILSIANEKWPKIISANFSCSWPHCASPECIHVMKMSWKSASGFRDNREHIHIHIHT